MENPILETEIPDMYSEDDECLKDVNKKIFNKPEVSKNSSI